MVQSTQHEAGSDDVRWRAVLRRDRAFDGALLYGVHSTGVFCRPSCPARRPARSQVEFFDSPQAALRSGFRPCLRCRPQQANEIAWIREACRFIESAAAEGPVTLARLAEKFEMNPHRLLREFKSGVGVSPRQFERACRMRALKANLREGQAVAGAAYESGFGSSSRLYEHSAKELGMTPGKYRKAGQGVAIRYAITPFPLETSSPCLLLIAATPRGLSAVRLGSSEKELRRGLEDEFPSAALASDPELLRWASAVIRHIDLGSALPEIPLDVRATAFERRVWLELTRIPRGQVATYRDVAIRIGNPDAARAVGRACGLNPVALIVPCHRVVRADGAPGGYRWGLERKAALLERERSAARQTAKK